MPSQRREPNVGNSIFEWPCVTVGRDQYDVAKLLDLGLVQPAGDAHNREDLTQDGLLAGTPAYMSPKQSGGEQPRSTPP